MAQMPSASSNSGVKLKDFGEEAIQNAGMIKAGGSAIQNNTGKMGVLTPAGAEQYNAIRDQYFAPLEQEYGITPDQLTKLFQSNAIPASVQQQLNSGFDEVYNNTLNPDTWYDKLLGQLALATTVGVATAGVGSAIGPALGGALGSTAGGIATGAVSGAAGGALSSALQGQNIGKGALIGGVSGGAGAAATPLTGALTSAGVNPTIAGALVKGGAGAATGALGAAVSGGNIGQAAELGGVSGAVKGGLQGSGLLQGGNALQNGLNNTAAGALTGAVRGALTGQGAAAGAAGGALNGATGAVTGSILSGAGTIFNSGSTDVQTQNPNLTTPAAHMGNEDPSYYNDNTDPYGNASWNSDYSNQGSSFQLDPSLFSGSPGNIDYAGLLSGLQSDPSLNTFNNNLNVQGGGTTLGGGYTDANGNTTAGNLTGGALAQFLASMGANHSAVGQNPAGTAGVGASGAGGSSSSNPLASLASLLSGGSGGGSSNLLAQLLGLGSSAVGGSLQSSAAKSAAGNFANQTQFSPYSVNTNNGSTSFNGTNATSTLSPGQQQTSNALGGLGQSSIQSLNAGPNSAANNYFNNLQANQQSANQRFMANTQDNEFSNGVLGSTAGQYQTQAALGALGQQTGQNQINANNFANTQQQNQLANLTASLNGQNQINQGQLAQTQLGAGIGAQASGANVSAYSPSLAANSNNNIGNLLATLGQTQNSGSSNQNALLQYLTGGH